MRILIIRHGDPDYVNDTVTEKGHREAEMLADRLAKEKIDYFYVSPLGRAQATAAHTLEKTGRQAVTLDWLQEFEPRIWRPDRTDKKTRVWDWLPQDWTQEDVFYDFDSWAKHPILEEGHVLEEYQKVCSGLDELLAKHGYVHEGRLFRVTQPNHDTICLFCHFGLQMVILSYLLHIPVMPLWHGFAAAPTSVTVLYSEERRRGTAYFRVQSFGDLTHLNVNGEEPSFHARFCECFEDDTAH